MKLIGGEALEGTVDCRAVLEGGGEVGKAAAMVEAGKGTQEGKGAFPRRVRVESLTDGF